MENLVNKKLNKKYNINDEEFVPFLKSLSDFSFGMEVLYNNGIFDEEKYLSLIQNQHKISESPIMIKIDEIIQGDKMDELQRFIAKEGINSIKVISKPFNDVEKMAIPIIHYSVIRKATKCFKYLLINDIEDPTKTMEEQNPDPTNAIWQSLNRYKWDCMAIAIYFGEIEILKILEEHGIEKGKYDHIEAAILSYRNTLAKEIINKTDHNYENMFNIILVGIVASIKSNNLNGLDFLLSTLSDNINKKLLNLAFYTYLLNWSIVFNSKEIFQIFVSKGADINAKDIINIVMKFQN